MLEFSQQNKAALTKRAGEELAECPMPRISAESGQVPPCSQELAYSPLGMRCGSACGSQDLH